MLLVLSAAASLVLAEATVRLVAPQQLILIRPDIWRPHDGLGWVQAPNIDTEVNTGEREVRLLTDSQGHRIGADKRSRAAYNVLAIGDSFQAALQVEHEQTFIALAEQQLSVGLGEPVDVVNGAVGGWGPSHYLIKARDELSRRHYDDVVVFFYLGNDVEAHRIDHFTPRALTERHPFRWPRTLASGEIVDSLLYPINDSLETRSHLFQFLKNRFWSLLMRFHLSARRFPSVLLRAEAASDRWAVSAGTCRLIADEAEAHGVRILFVLLPGVCEVDFETAEQSALAVGLAPREIDPDQPSRRMLRELEHRGLQVLDTTPLLRAAHAAGRQELYGRVDPHFGPAAHEIVAGAVAAYLLEAVPQKPSPSSGALSAITATGVQN